MKRRILLVDDEVAVLLTLKAVLEISGFDVDTAASAKDAKLKLRTREYAMVITDMRMENDVAGADVIRSARAAEYHPAIALLTAFPMGDEDWQEMDTAKVKVLMKPMQTKVLLQQIEDLLASHEAKWASIKKTPVAAGKVSLAAVAEKTPSARTPAPRASAKRTGTKAAAKKSTPLKKKSSSKELSKP